MSARWISLFAAVFALLPSAADWPQWRGLNRDAKVADFKSPATWPKELTQKWDVVVGDGVATPALVGERLYVFTRQGSNEVVRCLIANDGKEIWKDEYEVRGADGPAASFAGPRCTPAVAEGKVVTLGARGILSCYEAESGKKLWSKQDFSSWPQFYVSASPILVDGLCVVQLGGRSDGSMVAYDLASGEQKWKWTGATPSYASPMLLTVGDTKLIIGQVFDGIVAINAADGKHVWEVYFSGGGSRYKAATPIVHGDTLIYLDGPAKAIKLEKDGDKFVAKDQWANKESRVEYNTPVLKDGLLFGLSQRNELFCVRTADGSTAWSEPYPTPEEGAGGGSSGRGRGGGYGSVVDAGSVLMALNPSSQLIVYEPSEKEFKQLASYKVADKECHAYPIVAGNRIFVKDKDSVTLWTIE
jgi:outer membrane protein assembly factor BamB